MTFCNLPILCSLQIHKARFNVPASLISKNLSFVVNTCTLSTFPRPPNFIITKRNWVRRRKKKCKKCKKHSSLPPFLAQRLAEWNNTKIAIPSLVHLSHPKSILSSPECQKKKIEVREKLFFSSSCFFLKKDPTAVKSTDMASTKHRTAPDSLGSQPWLSHQ